MSRARRAATRAAIAIPVAALALTATLTPSSSRAATPMQVTEGEGWRLLNPSGVTSLGPGPYYIKWHDTTARTRLKALAVNSATHLTMHTGIKFVVTDEITLMPETGCAPYRVIVMKTEWRPLGVQGYSWGGACWGSADHALYSGKVKITSEWWEPNFWYRVPYSSQRMRNGVTHELGHAVGLGHPNYDKDGDGRVEDYECVTTATGSRPVMCSPWGGYLSLRSGQFTPYDIQGLKTLVRNYQYR